MLPVLLPEKSARAFQLSVLCSVTLQTCRHSNTCSRSRAVPGASHEVSAGREPGAEQPRICQDTAAAWRRACSPCINLTARTYELVTSEKTKDGRDGNDTARASFLIEKRLGPQKNRSGAGQFAGWCSSCIAMYSTQLTPCDSVLKCCTAKSASSAHATRREVPSFFDVE